MSVNEQTLVPYVVSTLRDTQVGIALAGRLGLPGADDLYAQEFQRQLAAGDVSGAAKTSRRQPERHAPHRRDHTKVPGPTRAARQPQPVFQYFHLLLERGKLNSLESMELAKLRHRAGPHAIPREVAHGGQARVLEQLGDLVVQSDVNMALSVYLRANVPRRP